MLILNGDTSNETINVLRVLQIKPNQDNKWSIDAGVLIGRQYINNNCEESEEPHFVRCDYFSRKYIRKYDKNYKVFEKNNVHFWFEDINESTTYILKGVTIRIKLTQDKPTNCILQFPQVIFFVF